MIHHLFSTSMLSRVVGIFILTGMFAFCRSGNSSKQPVTDTIKRTAKAPGRGTINENDNVNSAKKERKLIVYYFHTSSRCHSCITIEKLTRQAVTEGFSDRLKNSRIEFKVINVEDAANEHYVDDYKLYTKSVILSDQVNGKEKSWKNLDKVWTLLRDERKFIEYIRTEVRTLL